jgi:Zn-dependent protease with chaperone function
MKSITEYLQDRKCIFDYDKEDIEQINEFDPGTTSILLLYTLLSTAFYIVIKLFTFMISVTSFNKLIKKAQPLPEYDKKMSNILKQEIHCFIIKDKSPNAFNAGDHNCFMTDTLYDMLTDKERIAIFLHEYGHFHHNHSIILFGFELTFGTLAIITLDLILIYTFQILIPFVVPVLSGILGNYFTRKLSKAHEFEADKFVAEYGYQKPLISGLKKIEGWVRIQLCKKLNKEDCDKTIEIMHDYGTHPNFKERFERILATPTAQRFIVMVSLKQDDDGDDIFTSIKNFLKQKWTDIFGSKEVQT